MAKKKSQGIPEPGPVENCLQFDVALIYGDLKKVFFGVSQEVQDALYREPITFYVRDLGGDPRYEKILREGLHEEAGTVFIELEPIANVAYSMFETERKRDIAVNTSLETAIRQLVQRAWPKG